MEKYNFETISYRKGNGSMKWGKEHISRRFQVNINDQDEIYPMYIADLDFKLPPEILDIVHEKYKNPDFGYFDIMDSYYNSIIHWHKEIHNMDIKKEWIVPSIGTVASMNIMAEIMGQNKNFLIMTPVYRPFKGCCHPGTCFTFPLDCIHEQYKIDFDTLEQSFIQNKIDILLFCNPHNPGGKCWTKNELETLVRLCKKYKVLILSDEIHADIQLSEHKFTSLLQYQNEYDQIVVSTSPNKTFSLSGLSTSYILCSNKELRQKFQGFLDRFHFAPSRMGIEMTEIVYTHGQEWLKQMNKVVWQNVMMVKATMENLNISVMMPDAGFLVWVLLDSSVDVDQFILDIAQDQKIYLESGSRFIENYEGRIRINVGTSPSLVKEAMNRFAITYKKAMKQ